MKAKIKGYEIECSTQEFKELILEKKEKPITKRGRPRGSKKKQGLDRWSKEEVRILKKLRKQKIPVRVIALQLAKTRAQVYNKIHYLNR